MLSVEWRQTESFFFSRNHASGRLTEALCFFQSSFLVCDPKRKFRCGILSIILAIIKFRFTRVKFHKLLVKMDILDVDGYDTLVAWI